MQLRALPLSDRVYRWWALGVVIVGGFMSILDTSIVNIAVPKMMAVFSVGTDKIQWVLTAYMLAMGVVQPTTGFLCEVWGTRRLYIFSLIIFTVGSALCGFAWSNDTMIFFRVIQAIGGGMIIPVSMAIVYQVFPVEERNLAMGIWGISAMIAPAIGPTLSGYFVEHLDWRLIFTINIPVGIVGTLMAMLVLRETPLSRGVTFDYGGFITSGIGLFCLLLALSQGVDEGWTSPYIVSLLAVAAVCLSAFVVIELTHPDPILDLTLFKNATFTASIILTFVGTIGLFGAIFLIPLFMENLRGYTAMQTGILMFPAALASGLMMPVGGKLADKIGVKPLVLVGLSVLTVASYLLHKIDLNTARETILLLLVMRSLALGLYMMPVTVAGMNTVPLPKIGRASSLNNVIRQVSGSLGIAILTTVLRHRQDFHLSRMAESVNYASLSAQQAMHYLQGLFLSHGSTVEMAKTQALALLSGLGQRQAAVFAFEDTLLVAAYICALGFIPALFIKDSKKSHGKGMATID